jgi:hypothetical protein
MYDFDVSHALVGHLALPVLGSHWQPDGHFVVGGFWARTIEARMSKQRMARIPRL